ncbi:MAG TPA: hypothetical protein VHB48_18350 [Chitinophagaceae bacterium]|nr:hypothetical protein [Chitinophagaceae bacterium]
MIRNPYIVGWFVTVYLIVYVTLIQFPSTVDIAFCMMLFAPLLMVWLAFTVLRYGRYNGKEFGKDDEFGYQDKAKDTLGMF